MKLHFHPASTASRPVVFFMTAAKIAFEPVIVDIMTGAHMKEPFLTMNPSGMVPVLEDEGFILTESSAILKYVAEKAGSAAYPKDLQARARVNERMDWINTNFYRDWGYNLIYPQVFPHHDRKSPEAQKVTVQWGKERSERWLGILDKHIIGANKYICSNDITIADYFAAQVVGAGDLIGCNLATFANVDRWMKTMRAIPAWKTTNEVFDGFAGSLKGKEFVALHA